MPGWFDEEEDGENDNDGHRDHWDEETQRQAEAMPWMGTVDWVEEQNAIKGQGGVSERVLKFVVDTGCNMTLVQTELEDAMVDLSESTRAVQGFGEGMKRKAGQDGRLRIQFLRRDKTPVGTVKELDVTSMEGAQWNLLGVMYLVVMLGFTFMIKPDRSVGFVKFDDNTGLPVEELPAYIDDDTGLIIIEFVIAGTELDCRLASQAEEQVMQEDDMEHWTDWCNTSFVQYGKDQGFCGCRFECDHVSKLTTGQCPPCAPATAAAGIGDEENGEDEDNLFDRLYSQCESVVTPMNRPGDNRLTKQERHVKYGHQGHLPGCKVCAQGGHTRRVFRNYIRVQDDMPGRTWSWDAMTLSARDY